MSQEKTLYSPLDSDHADQAARDQAAQDRIRRALNEEWPSDVHPRVDGQSAVTPETQSQIGGGHRR